MSRRPLYALAAAGGLAVVAATSGAAGASPAAGYQVYEAPPSATMAYDNSVEPTIAANWKTGRAMIIADTTPYVVSFNNSARTATWAPAPGITTRYTTLDPIIWGDSENGRVIVSQLAGATSLMDISDDGGESWQPAQGGGPSGVDHQTLGGGPYAATNKPLVTTYPKAVWYCAQDIATSFCSISTDGGRTYGPSKPMYSVVGAGPLGACGGLHGHVNVRQDGTAMIPNKGCLAGAGTSLTLNDKTRKVGVALNSDNNTGPFTLETVPDSTSRGRMDPYVEADKANTMYLAYVDGTDKMKVAVKKKGGDWAKSVDVGKLAGVKSTAFPLVIGGSPGRAAVAYLGSKTGPVGDLDAQNTKFKGTWQMYVSTTTDSGRTWTTQQVTNDERFPVQVGCIRKTSNTCNHRNLYDFNGITVDKLGRVMVMAADGCTPNRGCVDGVTYDKQEDSGANGDNTNVGFIVRQECGPSLFADQQKKLDAACRIWKR
ncbi:MAG: hypothetical protein LC789_10625 [Actinobacteria bacterium]|nr:hypothetical protein [Actinomycetota bacterium]MCA1721567.1 hypothetical protein [Actinomycetota bacterium]